MLYKRLILSTDLYDSETWAPFRKPSVLLTPSKGKSSCIYSDIHRPRGWGELDIVWTSGNFMMMWYLQEITVGSSCSKVKSSQIPKNEMGGSRSMLKHWSRWGDAGRKAVVDLLQIQKRKMAARNREGYRKEIGEATAQKCTRALNKVEK